MVNKKHQINKIHFQAKLYFENIGPDPFSSETKIFKILRKSPNKDSSKTFSQLETKQQENNFVQIESDTSSSSKKSSLGKKSIPL